MSKNAQDAPTSATLPRNHEQSESRGQTGSHAFPQAVPPPLCGQLSGKVEAVGGREHREPGEGDRAGPASPSVRITLRLPPPLPHPPPRDLSPCRALPGGPWPQEVALRHLLMEEPCEQVTSPSQYCHQSKSGATYITWAPSLQFHVKDP